MVRLHYIALAVLTSLLPFTPFWLGGGPDALPGSAGVGHHHHYDYYLSSGGGHGGWLGHTYGWGRGSYDTLGGASDYRSGGPGGGGK